MLLKSFLLEVKVILLRKVYGRFYFFKEILFLEGRIDICLEKNRDWKILVVLGFFGFVITWI